jgi:hypothetical protein
MQLPQEEEPLVITPTCSPTTQPDERVDFERGMSYWSPATLGLLVTLVVVFGWQLASGRSIRRTR